MTNPFQDRSQISHIWLTRECNLSCGYCRVVRDTPGLKPVADYAKDELTAKHWFENIKILNKLGSKFFLLYGAEPILFKPLGELIDLLNQTDIHYSVHSNGTLQNELDELLTKHPLKGLTFSWDPTVYDRNVLGKSNVAMKLFTKYKEKVSDLVVTITLLPNITEGDNIEKLLDGIQWFHDNGIWSIVTVIDHARNEHYDFSNVKWIEENKIKVNDRFLELLSQLKSMYNNGVKFHNYPEYFDELVELTTKENYACETPWSVNVIDADGSIRLCNRIKGDEVAKYTPADMIEKPEEVIQAFKNDYKKMCRGCGWDCVMQSTAHKRYPEKYSKKDIDKQFTH